MVALHEICEEASDVESFDDIQAHSISTLLMFWHHNMIVNNVLDYVLVQDVGYLLQWR